MKLLFLLLSFAFIIQGVSAIKIIPREKEPVEETPRTETEALLHQLEQFNKEEAKEVAETSLTLKQLDKLPKPENVVVQEEKETDEEEKKVIEIDRNNSQMARIIKQQNPRDAEAEAPEGFEFETIR
jgi:hypothetical protein